MTTQRTQTQHLNGFLFLIACLAALIVSMWQAGTASAQDTGPKITVSDRFPEQGESVAITLTGFPTNTLVYIFTGDVTDTDSIDVTTDDGGTAVLTHEYHCQDYDVRIRAVVSGQPQHPPVPETVYGPIIYTCQSPISVNDIFPAQGEVVTITLTGFPAGQYTHLDFGNPPPYNEVDIAIYGDTPVQVPHTYDCGAFQIRAWPLSDPTEVSSTWIFPCGGPPVGDPDITVSNSEPAAGEVVTFTLYGFPRNAWIHVDFGGDGSPEEKEVNVFTNGMGGTQTTHTFACGHFDTVTAWALEKPEDVTDGPWISTADCPSEPRYVLYDGGSNSTLIVTEGGFTPFSSETTVWVETTSGLSVSHKTTEIPTWQGGAEDHSWLPAFNYQLDGEHRIVAVYMPDDGVALETTSAEWAVVGRWFVRGDFSFYREDPKITGPNDVFIQDVITFTIQGARGFTATVGFRDVNNVVENQDVFLGDDGVAEITHQFSLGSWIVEVQGGNAFVLNAHGFVPELIGPFLAKAGEIVTFTVRGKPFGEVTFDFGDGSNVVVVLDAEGNGKTDHVFAVGEWRVYANTIGGAALLVLEVTADGNPPVQTEQLFLPLVTR